MQSTEEKLFYYTAEGDRPEAKIGTIQIELISETELPPPSEELKGKCASDYHTDDLDELENGSIVDLAFGDPFVLEGCVSIPFGNVPLPVQKYLYRDPFLGKEIQAFSYNGKRFWVWTKSVCHLEIIRSTP